MIISGFWTFLIHVYMYSVCIFRHFLVHEYVFPTFTRICTCYYESCATVSAVVAFLLIFDVSCYHTYFYKWQGFLQHNDWLIVVFSSDILTCSLFVFQTCDKYSDPHWPGDSVGGRCWERFQTLPQFHS